jgi:hypothetical protein
VCTSHNDATVQIYYESPLCVNSSEQQHVLPLAFSGSKQQPILELVNELAAASQYMSQALVEHLVVAGKDADVPFTPYITKCQRKKINKATVYLTRSKGPAPSPPQ